MKAELFNYTGDLLVVNAARVSYGKETSKFRDNDAKLIKYLAEHHHWLPFRHPHITLRCTAPIFVARQLGKHQVGFDWSEESRRYISGDVELYEPDEWRGKPEDSKQGSAGVIKLHPYFEDNIKDVADVCVNLYNTLLARGVAPEQARMVLPQSMMINWIWTGSLLAWMHMYKQRTAPDAQKEVQMFAHTVAPLIRSECPTSWDYLKSYYTP